jgi:hypothetical protein
MAILILQVVAGFGAGWWSGGRRWPLWAAALLGGALGGLIRLAAEALA